jgi:hypothetical protein
MKRSREGAITVRKAEGEGTILAKRKAQSTFNFRLVRKERPSLAKKEGTLRLFLMEERAIVLSTSTDEEGTIQFPMEERMSLHN